MNIFFMVPVVMLISITSACAPTTDEQAKDRHPGTPPTAEKLISESLPQTAQETLKDATPREDSECPRVTNAQIDPGAKVRKSTVFLHRIMQKVTRKNCDGQVLSEKVETIISPDRDIELLPTRWLGVRPFVSSIQNRTTCSATGENLERSKEKFISTFGTPKTYFKISYVPMSAAITVNDGLNYIDYQFAQCDEYTDEILPNSRGDGKLCTKYHILEKGTILLSVYYGETEIKEPRVLVDCTDRT